MIGQEFSKTFDLCCTTASHPASERRPKYNCFNPGSTDFALPHNHSAKLVNSLLSMTYAAAAVGFL